MDYPIKDVPQNLMDEVCNQLMCYSVPILGLSPEKPGPNLKLLGSGTLVEFEGKHNILTAAHVWHATEGAQEIGGILTEHPRSSFVRMRRDSITVRCLWGGNNSAWGPDLALLELSYPDVSIIAARKSFVNLSRQKAMLASRPPNIEKGLWAVIGTVGELSSIHFSQQEQIETAAVHERAFFSLVQGSYQNNGYDFLDLSAKMDLPDVPSSFCGVSGGGIWEVGVSIDESGRIFWDEKRLFRGVQIGQTKVSDGRRMIRCHGPKSIFEKAWDEWAFPQKT